MRVAYEDTGTGLPIVFIPGLPGNSAWFAYQLTGLQQNYRVISYSLRSEPRTPKCTVDLLADDLADLLSALRIRSAVIAGVSFGGMIAQNMAVRYRDMVSAVVLISAFPSLPDTPRNTLAGWMSPGTKMPETWLQSFIRRILNLRPPAMTASPEGIDWLISNSPELPQVTLDNRLNIIAKFDSTDWLAGIGVPTLVVVGAKDHPPFLAGARRLYEGIPRSQLEVVEDGDHFCFFTRHDVVNGLIDDFAKAHLTRL